MLANVDSDPGGLAILHFLQFPGHAAAAAGTWTRL